MVAFFGPEKKRLSPRGHEVNLCAQAAFWNVTVVNLDPVQPGDNKLWSISTSRSAFLNSPAFEPDVVLGQAALRVQQRLAEMN